MFPFLSLPREIRDTIYRMSLHVGTINPHPTSHHSIAWWDKNVPTLGLLAVSKKIRAEARPVFYTTNLWQIVLEPKEQTLFHKGRTVAFPEPYNRFEWGGRSTP